MSDRGDSDAKGDDRAARLAEALRENLRRRKAQARRRREPEPAGPGNRPCDGSGNRPGQAGQGEAAEDGPRD